MRERGAKNLLASASNQRTLDLKSRIIHVTKMKPTNEGHCRHPVFHEVPDMNVRDWLPFAARLQSAYSGRSFSQHRSWLQPGGTLWGRDRQVLP